MSLQQRHQVLKEMKLIIQKLSIKPDQQLERVLVKLYKQAREKPADSEESFISDLSSVSNGLSTTFYDRVEKFRYTDSIDNMLQSKATWLLPQNDARL